METKLEELRKAIDSIDGEIIRLLAQRMEVVKQVGNLKQANKAIIYRPEREKYILDRLEKLSEGTLLRREAIDAIFMEIFAASRNFELPERVAYLGPEGSFTHQAAESRFGFMSDYLVLGSIRAIFESVLTGRARFGVIPIENNYEGFVRETIDLLYELPVKIVAEVLLPVHLTFVSYGDRLGDIKRVYSRSIAFKQCDKFLREYFNENQLELIPVESTSRAAQMASKDKEAAAICSSVAAKRYGVPILFENIEDSAHNRTRFYIISKEFDNKPSGQDKSTIIAHLPNVVGSLANFLQDFNQHNVNVLKIESRPAREGSGFNSWFYIELEGHYQDENVQTVLSKQQDNIRYLGSYVRLT